MNMIKVFLSKVVRPLSAPPMRRPCPPARTTAATPCVAACSTALIEVETVRTLARAGAVPRVRPSGRDMRLDPAPRRVDQQPAAVRVAGRENAAAVIFKEQTLLAAHVARADAFGWRHPCRSEEHTSE